MADRQIKVPDEAHPVSIAPNPARVVVTLGGRTVADTKMALTLREASYAPVHYIPRKDVDMAMVERSDHGSYCPFKGDASYFSLPAWAPRSVNAIWSYEAPFPAVAAIKDHFAFYPDRVDAIEEFPLA